MEKAYKITSKFPKEEIKEVYVMNFYTVVFKKSGIYWVTLCLENGLVAQGKTKEMAIEKLREAITSLEAARKEDLEIYSALIPVRELHEFLEVEQTECVNENETPPLII